MTNLLIILCALVARWILGERLVLWNHSSIKGLLTAASVAPFFAISMLFLMAFGDLWASLWIWAYMTIVITLLAFGYVALEKRRPLRITRHHPSFLI